MSNFTTSWKFLEKLEEAGSQSLAKYAEAGAGLGQDELEASWKLDAEPARDKLEPSGELEKFVKFYTSWKFTRVKYMYKYSASWKLESLTARQAGNFKIIKFIFINKFLFLFNFKK